MAHRAASVRTRRRYARAWLLAAAGAYHTCSVCNRCVIRAATLGWGRVWQILTNPTSVETAEAFIVWELRLPQAIMAVVAGAALGLAGAEMQTVLDNPLASPFTLGVSSAAALGAALALVLGIQLPYLSAQYAVSVNAFAMALLCCLVLDLAARRLHMAQHGIVLLGIALVFGFNAIVAMIQLLSDAAALQDLLYWMMGSLGGSRWPHVMLLGCILFITIGVSMRQSWKLTALRFGEERAGSFGIDTKRVRRWALLRISILAGTVVALIGVIGFVGLVAPHIARRLWGEDHRWYLPASAVTGAFIMLGASVLAKQLSSQIEIPVGIVTTLVGIPFFIVVLSRRRALE